MNYQSAVKEAETNNIHIEPHVIPLGMAWRMSGGDVVEDITWSDVCAQTPLKLDDSELAWLEEQSPENRLQFLVEELGYAGVLLMVTSAKQLGESGGWRYIESYAYLADPDREQVGAEIGKLVERVLVSWREEGKCSIPHMRGGGSP